MATQAADQDHERNSSSTSYLQGCIQKNLDRPDLVTPSLVDAQYLEWLSGLPNTDMEGVMRKHAEVRLLKFERSGRHGT